MLTRRRREGCAIEVQNSYLAFGHRRRDGADNLYDEATFVLATTGGVGGVHGTPNTMSTTLSTVDLNTPQDSDADQQDRGVMNLGMSMSGVSTTSMTRSAPCTPGHGQQPAITEVKGTAAADKPLNGNDYYRAGIGQLYNGLFSCFRPVWGYFGKTQNPMTHSIGDDWEIPFESITNLEWLGAGSQGAVFSGQLNCTTVAVKKVKELKETDVQHLRHLEHENVVKFIGVCTQAPCFCLVMEFCPGGQLCEILKRDLPIAPLDWVAMARQVAEGMNFLHKNKVVHRDLKSPNILLGADGKMKISDFGTAQQRSTDHSALMSFCGTVSWMAPEMIKKEPCSEKVDVWSFGVVLWEFVTRAQPYKNVDSMAILWGVGSNNLSLPLPSELPDGLCMLMKQCWSQKARNRPSFNAVLQHLGILKNELQLMSDEEWVRKRALWKEEALNIQYPETLQGHGPNLAGLTQNRDEKELLRKRREELRHAMDIREMYEAKLRRANKMYQKLTMLLEELNIREEEVAHRERVLVERLHAERVRGGRIGSFSNCHGTAPPAQQWGVQSVIRAGPRSHKGEHTQDVYCSAITQPSPYCGGGAGGPDWMSSSEDDLQEQYADSPHRESRASSCSGFPSTHSFSRQSSQRSSQGMKHSKTSPARTHASPFSRDPSLRQSTSSQWTSEMVRNSPARASGLSEDSGVQVWGDRVNSCSRLSEVGSGQAACYSQTFYRNAEGRWSDGTAKRRPKKPSFIRDSPARIGRARSKDRVQPTAVDKRNVREKSVYDNDGDMYDPRRASTVSAVSEDMSASPSLQTDLSNVSQVIPPSSSYSEALSTVPTHCAVLVSSDPAVSEVRYTNPLYTSPITSYSPTLLRVNIDPNADLTSSIDSNNPVPPQNASSNVCDASGESSSDEEDVRHGNGNLYDSSMDSDRLKNAFDKEKKEVTTTDDEANILNRRREELLLMESSMSMASSLERSLELGAIHSDGLSDKEMAVKRVRQSIKGHRRTHSAGQPAVMMSVVCETSTESEGEPVHC